MQAVASAANGRYCLLHADGRREPAKEEAARSKDSPGPAQHRGELRIVALGFVFFAYGMVVVQAFNGAGDTVTPSLINFVCFWMIKIPLAYLLAVHAGMGPRGAFIAVTIAYSAQTVAALVLFRRGGWKAKRI